MDRSLVPKEEASGVYTDDWKEGIVVFLIGMRVNRWWRPDLYLPIIGSMRRMLRELLSNPELGLLGITRTGPSNPLVLVQYWRSLEHLQRFARSADHPHLSAWGDFNRRVRATNAVGVWHETYIVPAGEHESVYVNMPAFGLAAVGGRRRSHPARR